MIMAPTVRRPGSGTARTAARTARRRATAAHCPTSSPKRSLASRCLNATFMTPVIRVRVAVAASRRDRAAGARAARRLGCGRRSSGGGGAHRAASATGAAASRSVAAGSDVALEVSLLLAGVDGAIGWASRKSAMPCSRTSGVGGGQRPERLALAVAEVAAGGLVGHLAADPPVLASISAATPARVSGGRDAHRAPRRRRRSWTPGAPPPPPARPARDRGSPATTATQPGPPRVGGRPRGVGATRHCRAAASADAAAAPAPLALGARGRRRAPPPTRPRRLPRARSPPPCRGAAPALVGPRVAPPSPLRCECAPRSLELRPPSRVGTAWAIAASARRAAT